MGKYAYYVDVPVFAILFKFVNDLCINYISSYDMKGVALIYCINQIICMELYLSPHYINRHK